MAATFCPHLPPLSKAQDWYSAEPIPAETRPLHGYEIRKVERYQRVKRSYAEHSIAARRRKMYEDALVLLLAERDRDKLASSILARERALDLQRRLQQQADKWERETSHLSSPLQRMMHPSYQAILGISAENAENKRETIRFMLNDLKKTQRDWFLALSYLTQQNPIGPDDYGKTGNMTVAWLKWGEENGLL